MFKYVDEQVQWQYWMLRGQQMLQQRWLCGIQHLQATKLTTSTQTLKPWADIVHNRVIRDPTNLPLKLQDMWKKIDYWGRIFARLTQEERMKLQELFQFFLLPIVTLCHISHFFIITGSKFLLTLLTFMI